MRAPISVVIVALNDERNLALQLSALGEALAEGLIRELIVVDGGSRDGTLQVAEAAGAVILRGPPSRAAALSLGIEEASGEWLLVPAPKSAPAPGWTTGLWRHLERAPGKRGRLPARPLATGFWGAGPPAPPRPGLEADAPHARRGRGAGTRSRELTARRPRRIDPDGRPI